MQSGADLIGYVSAKIFESLAPVNHRPSDLLQSAKTVITLAAGRQLNEDRHYLHATGPSSAITYITLSDSVSLKRRRAQTCLSSIYELIRQTGYHAVVEPHGWSSILSFKQAAVNAGLGILGKGGFVIHPTLGTINVLGCIVTDASIPSSKPMNLDLCRNCTACIYACKYGAYTRVDNVYMWEANKCRFYQIVDNAGTRTRTYGPCSGDCINSCPVGSIKTEKNQVRSFDPITESLDVIIEEIKPHIIGHDRQQRLTTIQHICAHHALTLVPYPTLNHVFDFVIGVSDNTLKNELHCKKIGVKILNPNQHYSDTLYDLRDILNHEWAILTINPDGSYNFDRPLIWSKIQGIKSIINQI